MNTNNQTIKNLKIFNLQIKLLKLSISMLYILVNIFNIEEENNNSKEDLINLILKYFKELNANGLDNTITIIDDTLLNLNKY